MTFAAFSPEICLLHNCKLQTANFMMPPSQVASPSSSHAFKVLIMQAWPFFVHGVERTCELNLIEQTVLRACEVCSRSHSTLSTSSSVECCRGLILQGDAHVPEAGASLRCGYMWIDECRFLTVTRSRYHSQQRSTLSSNDFVNISDVLIRASEVTSHSPRIFLNNVCVWIEREWISQIQFLTL